MPRHLWDDLIAGPIDEKSAQHPLQQYPMTAERLAAWVPIVPVAIVLQGGLLKEKSGVFKKRFLRVGTIAAILDKDMSFLAQNSSYSISLIQRSHQM